jgi:hypothetical protein
MVPEVIKGYPEAEDASCVSSPANVWLPVTSRPFFTLNFSRAIIYAFIITFRTTKGCIKEKEPLGEEPLNDVAEEAVPVLLEAPADVRVLVFTVIPNNP